MSKALITGILGQDGSYLAEYLLSLGYSVHGTIRSAYSYSTNAVNIINKCSFHYADLTDELSLEKVIRRVHPDEIYNLAAQSFVPPSWTYPAETFDVNAGGLVRILKIVEKVCPKAKVYQASTSEMYGNVLTLEGSSPLCDTYTSESLRINETFRMNPVSPYGVAKYAAHKLVDCYRQKGLYVVSGILFNHESPRRGEEMVTRKITKHISRWANGDKAQLRLGSRDSKRDWGYAGDYVKAMWRMLQNEQPADYVIGTGEAHSVDEFYTLAMQAANLDIRDFDTVWDAPEFTRSNELHVLIADASKSERELSWIPEVSFEGLVKMMVDNDCKATVYA